MKKQFLALILLICGCSYGSPGQALFYGAVSAPVLITLQNGETGSGFYLSCSNHLFLATARHVLLDANAKPKAPEATLLSIAYVAGAGDVELRVNLDALQTNGQIRFHPAHDVAIVRIAKATPDKRFWFDDITVKHIQYPKGGPALVGPEMTKRLADVAVGEDVFVFGYPTSIGLRQSPKFDYSKPLLRRGIVSGIYPKAQTIILDSSVYFGNSGGPVMAVSSGKEFKVIGVVSEMIPFVDVWENKQFRYGTANLSNSGYSVVEPVDFLLDLTWD